MRKILFVASEGVPFIKTGGLADVVGSLPKCIDKEHYDVRVILPKYTCMKQEYKDMLEYQQHFYSAQCSDSHRVCQGSIERRRGKSPLCHGCK